ncbi:MAG: LPS export ABC transporter periplasmic protein LptC [Dissulfuribacterales bacterium]
MRFNWNPAAVERSHVLVVMVIVLSVSWFYWQSWMEQRELKKDLMKRLSGITADFMAEGVYYYRLSDGKLNIKVQARQAVFLDNDRMDVEEPIISFLSSDGRRILMRAARGFYRMNDSLTLQGDVRMEFPSYGTLSTSELFYDEAKKLVWTKAPVLFSGEAMSIAGEGLEYGFDTGGIRVFRPQAQISPKSGKLLGW